MCVNLAFEYKRSFLATFLPMSDNNCVFGKSVSYREKRFYRYEKRVKNVFALHLKDVRHKKLLALNLPLI